MALDVYVIPFSNQPQTFSCVLSGVGLQMTNRWNDKAGVWMVDIDRAADGQRLISGLPLVTGCDLLAQHRYLGLDGHIFCHNDGDSDDPPTYDNLGVNCFVYYTPVSIPAFEGY